MKRHSFTLYSVLPGALMSALLLISVFTSVNAAPSQPNIVIILTDDMGYSDIGCYGGEIRTPSLDALAAKGIRFTQFYNTARCCPTRASLLTGLHPHQAGIGHMMEDRKQDGYRGDLNRQCLTIAEALKPAGYRNYAVGKWHVTPGASSGALTNRHNWPLQRGFDRYYGTIHGAGSYFDPSALVRDNTLITIANDIEYQPSQFYYTDAIADHAVKFIQDHARTAQKQPFFLYTAFTAAHWPLHAKESDIAKYKGKYDGGYEAIRKARRSRMARLGFPVDKWGQGSPAESWDDVKNKEFETRCMEVYAAQVDCMDQGVGRIVAELKTQGLLHNTLIFYLQDNGGCAENIGRGGNGTARGQQPSLPPMSRDEMQYNSTPKQTRDGWPVRQGYGVMPGGPDTYIAYGRGWANVSNTPFREYKHWTHEGGISTPLIAHWPKGIAANRRGKFVSEPGQLVDIMATCMDVAGATYPVRNGDQLLKPLEGRSLAPLFASSPKKQPERFLYWEHEGNRAVRLDRWKLVAKENKPWELYDMGKDRTELADLAGSKPEQVKTLASAWEAWAARANVLPLGAWRDKNAARNENGSSERRFELKKGDHLARDKSPAIAGRAFKITAQIETDATTEGVIVAQGGSAHGYSLFMKAGKAHFLVRSSWGSRSLESSISQPGKHTVTAQMDAGGSISLVIDGVRAGGPADGQPLKTMPADGLDVGSDTGGLVGPYSASNAFTGAIYSLLIELP